MSTLLVLKRRSRIMVVIKMVMITDEAYMAMSLEMDRVYS